MEAKGKKGKTKYENVLSWASELDEGTLQQAAKTARLPFVAGHVALMPDAHIGLGATIGSVIPTQGAIVPAAVGVDIGCGMIAVETPLTSHALPDDLRGLHDRIARAVPAGVGQGHKGHKGRWTEMDEPRAKHWPTIQPATELPDRLRTKSVSQFGTLGSGNHFVEVCLDERDHVWVVLHSGSRGVGNELATQHIATAKGVMKQLFIHLEDPSLAYLVEGTPEFDAYIADMLWAQDYALGNREAMMDAVLHELAEELDLDPLDELARINCHHNYSAREEHHGREVWLTRKGAIRARTGDRGVIPGSMGTRSYIVKGLGNPASYRSCSHGAGRRLSRTAARRTLDVEGLRRQMAGKAWNERSAKQLLDEDPRSYKDIDQVMADQADLVEVEHTLGQILNYKGT
jgi:tRNA-splicing ligase RtcB (3'-phosphate/5'-hydroxy nucleic acid ligase)